MFQKWFCFLTYFSTILGPFWAPKWPPCKSSQIEAGFQEGPRIAQDRPRWPKITQDGHNIPPRGPQDCPRWSKTGPGRPKTAQDHPRRPQDGPKMAPRRPRLPKMALPGPQNSPKTAQDGPKTAQNEPKTDPSTLSGKIFRCWRPSRLCRLNKDLIRA